MPSKRPKVMIYLSEEMKAELSAWAKQEKRSVSNLVTLLVEDALYRHREKSRPENQVP